MKPWLKDTVGLGTALWLLGYLVSLALFFTPLAGVMGWIITAVFTPVTVGVAWWRFRGRDLPLAYYAGVGLAWTAIAVVLDYLFIVRLFDAVYYAPDVFVYYALTFLIPVGVGLYLRRTRGVSVRESWSGRGASVHPRSPGVRLRSRGGYRSPRAGRNAEPHEPGAA